MKRLALVPPAQTALNLGDDRVHDPLFVAYSQSRLSERGITFEKARITPHLRLPLERVAKALAKKEPHA